MLEESARTRGTPNQGRRPADPLVGCSAAFARTRRLIECLAPERAPVLITGETGVGKELVARALHTASDRSHAAFVVANCSALPEGTLESELFGHERGAFTGAVERRRGRFELAHRGTLFLDEIGDASLRLQAAILRVVETGCLERVGGSRTLSIDVRVVAATHRDLPSDLAKGRFREDLWHRLAILRIEVPPLRERGGDVEEIARQELQKLAGERGGEPIELHVSAVARLQAHDWPGNVRELLGVVKRMSVFAGGRGILYELDVERALGPVAANSLDGVPGGRRRYRQAERAALLEALWENGWNVSSAARRLGLGRGALRHRMRRYGLDP